MYRNNVELQRFLLNGGTIVVPSRQRAAAVRLAFTAEQYSRGLRIWETPDVLPWQAWLQRETGAAPPTDGLRPRVLAPMERWLLWREVVREAATDSGVLLPDTLIETVQRASALMDDWGIGPVTAGTEEAALLLRCRKEFARRCGLLNVVDACAWRDDVRPWIRPTWLVGFDSIGTHLAAALRRRGARIDSLQETPATRDRSPISVRRFDHPAEELEQAALWCRQCLRRDPQARVLLVVPELERNDALVRRALTHALQARETYAGNDAEPMFALEGGLKLASYPMVQAALSLLRFSGLPLHFIELSALLRSVYLQFGSFEARVRLELWLRDQNAVTVELPLLRTGLELVRRQLGAVTAEMLALLLDALAVPDGLREAPSWWARRFAAMLKACGWTDLTALGSRELQVRQRFDQLLGEFAAVGDVAGRISCSAALEMLCAWVAEASLEPASDDVPVTVTSALSDPLVRYDGIWVTGLTVDIWPQPPNPDPMLPLALQLAAGMGFASAVGRLRQAGDAMQAWQRCSEQLYLSWPRHRDDVEQEPSPLLPAESIEPRPAAAQLVSETADQWQLAAALQTYRDRPALPWTPGRRLPGGSRALELQAECPFRACAQLRLHCEPLHEPAAGLGARARGLIVHRSLEQIWRQLEGSVGLQQRSQAAILSLVRDCVSRALVEITAAMLAQPPARLLRVERQRTEQLLLALLDIERGRRPFAIEALEWTQIRQIAGFPVHMRLDRLDRLEDGRVAVIDFKSGAPRRFDPLAEPPTQTQLLSYSVVAGPRLAAVAAVHLEPRGISWRGLAEAAGRLPEVPIAAASGLSWNSVLQSWQAQIEGLAQEFGAGRAEVAPQPQACAHCHLRLLCRIDTPAVDGSPNDA